MPASESTNGARPSKDKANRYEIVLQIGQIPDEDITAFARVLAQAAVAEVISKWGLDGRSDQCDDTDQTLEKRPRQCGNTDEAKEQVE